MPWPIEKLSFINPPIVKFEYSKTIHFSVFEFASIDIPVGPFVNSFTFEYIILELSTVLGAILPGEDALAIFNAYEEIANIICAYRY